MKKQEEHMRRDSGDFHQGRDDDMGVEAERQTVAEMGDPLLLSDEQVALKEIAFIERLLERGHPDKEGLGMTLLDWITELGMIRDEMNVKTI